MPSFQTLNFHFLIVRSIVVCLLFITLNGVGLSRAQATEETLFSFGSQGSVGLVTLDAQGNIYGARATCDNTHRKGYIYRLKKGPLGTWTMKILYQFTGGSDGGCPNDGLIFDAAGNFYGTSGAGGISGNGVVFELIPGPSDTWTEKVLHSFTGIPDGGAPGSGLIFDSAGNLYGTAGGGMGGPVCQIGCGVVFELSPDGSGGWTEKINYTFTGGSDGRSPSGRPTIDAAGNLYGTTNFGGSISAACPTGCGVIYKLTPQAGGTWSSQSLYAFCAVTNCADGADPRGEVVFDQAGNLYGATNAGGNIANSCVLLNGCGTIFELKPAVGSWTHTVLHTFADTEGFEPSGYLLLNSQGEIYGTVSGSSSVGDRGAVFQLKPGASGWTFNTIYSFCSLTNCADGNGPADGLTLGSDGNYYGTTSEFGAHGDGTVYEITFKTPTTNTLTSSANPAWKGQPITFTATLTSTAGSPADGELVTFYNGTALLGTVPLSNGSASLTTNKLAVGTHSISSVYGGDTTLVPRTSTALKQVVNAATPTTTSVTSNHNPSTFGRAVTFTAHVSSTVSIPNGGLVTFFAGATQIGTATTTGGVATFNTSTLGVGTKTIKATYAGGGMLASSSGTITQTVNKQSTTITLTSSLNPSNYGQPVTFTAKVGSSGSHLPTGTVVFKDGTTSIGSVVLSAGSAALTKPKLATGSHPITATYNGDVDSTASTSTVLTQTVN
jgi:uncharacterized repeat protein (TIGR03803 family)